MLSVVEGNKDTLSNFNFSGFFFFKSVSFSLVFLTVSVENTRAASEKFQRKLCLAFRGKSERISLRNTGVPWEQGLESSRICASIQVLPFARDLNFAKGIIIYMLLFRAALTEMLFSV